MKGPVSHFRDFLLQKGNRGRTIYHSTPPRQHPQRLKLSFKVLHLLFSWQWTPWSLVINADNHAGARTQEYPDEERVLPSIGCTKTHLTIRREQNRPVLIDWKHLPTSFNREEPYATATWSSICKDGFPSKMLVFQREIPPWECTDRLHVRSWCECGENVKKEAAAWTQSPGIWQPQTPRSFRDEDQRLSKLPEWTRKFFCVYTYAHIFGRQSLQLSSALRRLPDLCMLTHASEGGLLHTWWNCNMSILGYLFFSLSFFF